MLVYTDNSALSYLQKNPKPSPRQVRWLEKMQRYDTIRYGDESISEAPKLERTGAGTDPVRAAGPEEPRGRKLVGFGNLFGLQDIYEGDEVHTQSGQIK